jgi:hypothetical protein
MQTVPGAVTQPVVGYGTVDRTTERLAGLVEG